VELSAKSEYALRALIEMAAAHDRSEPMRIREVADRQQIPDRYLEQLLAVLRRNGLVRSQRGAKGGYLLAREPWQISVLEIIRCIEGHEPLPVEASGPSLESYLIQELRQELTAAAEAVLEGYSLQALVDRRNERLQADIMYYI
jgi:Rrf2 family protein